MIEIYPDGSNLRRWRYRATNGQISASSGEAFDSRRNAKRAARRAALAMAFAKVKEY